MGFGCISGNGRNGHAGCTELGYLAFLLCRPDLDPTATSNRTKMQDTEVPTAVELHLQRQWPVFHTPAGYAAPLLLPVGTTLYGKNWEYAKYKMQLKFQI
jgi:hypothetical protein